MRGVVFILGAVLAVAAGMTARAQERLVTACEVAVLAHADGVALSLSLAEQSAAAVTLEVSFTNGGKTYRGEAECRFRDSDRGEPPSLAHLEVMERSGPGMFLISHLAIWEYFAGPVHREEANSDPEPEQRLPAGTRRLAAR